jgi:hypothetical protein
MKTVPAGSGNAAPTTTDWTPPEKRKNMALELTTLKED